MTPGVAGDPSVFAVALDWLTGTLLGPLGSTIAVLIVASVGFFMLTGRVDFRRAGQVILGCFILFGASAIASGFLSALKGTRVPVETAPVQVAPVPTYPPPPPIAQGSPSAFDPYAGAALPTR